MTSSLNKSELKQQSQEVKADEKSERWQKSVDIICRSKEKKTYGEMKTIMQDEKLKIHSLAQQFAASCYEEDCFLMSGPHQHRIDYMRAQWSQPPDRLLVAIFQMPLTDDSKPVWIRACKNSFH